MNAEKKLVIAVASLFIAAGLCAQEVGLVQGPNSYVEDASAVKYRSACGSDSRSLACRQYWENVFQRDTDIDLDPIHNRALAGDWAGDSFIFTSGDHERMFLRILNPEVIELNQIIQLTAVLDVKVSIFDDGRCGWTNYKSGQSLSGPYFPISRTIETNEKSRSFFLPVGNYSDGVIVRKLKDGHLIAKLDYYDNDSKSLITGSYTILTKNAKIVEGSGPINYCQSHASLTRSLSPEEIKRIQKWDGR